MKTTKRYKIQMWLANLFLAISNWFANWKADKPRSKRLAVFFGWMTDVVKLDYYEHIKDDCS